MRSTCRTPEHTRLFDCTKRWRLPVSPQGRYAGASTLLSAARIRFSETE